MNRANLPRLIALLATMASATALSACVPQEPADEQPLIVVDDDPDPTDTDAGGDEDTSPQPDVDEEPETVCTNACSSANDGQCDDGGTGALFESCAYGTDCADCGERPVIEEPDPDPDPEPDPEPICTDSCQYANDGECDDGGPAAQYDVCTYGTDCGDCGSRDARRSCNSNAECSEGRVCNATGQCVSSQGASSIEFVTLTDFQATAQDVWDSEFEVGGDVRSVSLIVEMMTPSATAYIWEVGTPQNTLLYDIERSEQSLMKLNPVTYGGQMGILLPNSPQYALSAGTYRVRLWTEDTSRVRVHALIKRGPLNPQGGTLPVTFWFTDQDYMDASEAQRSTAFQEGLEVFRQIYANIGIAIGPVRYRDVEGTLGRQLAVPQDEVVLCEGIRQVATEADLSGINLFMIDQAADQSFLGISCGLPGASTRPGVARAGAAIALAYLDFSPEIFGETVAHEAGHYLGLFHTTERDGASHDPLDDTPECPSSRDSNGDDFVSPEECINLSADNTMFWTSFSQGGRQTTLTPHQRFVLMNNALIETY
ncbi:hypothetical protein FRC96_09620 [Lujinxingia vulgaris]|uniref:Peptidase M43 pregnancy-associated plasma-A domain-containing protein n=1 Tax=Lujinxingia vulgaris TaxID=2600176 RepID=A0A5C6XC43_9DELT|nr:hypothetical protein [Lujinxingia vulgaris]TXD36327.1 hypothetical protein FRC96_09620 [Lujinxingia vulgaris]